MKSQKGITVTSLIIYVTAMIFVIAAITTLTGYFYGNLDRLTTRTDASKEYTKLISYFVNDVNSRENTVYSYSSSKIVFSNGNQYTFDSTSKSIYFNQIQICEEVTNCTFAYNSSTKQITVTMTILGETYTNTYTLANKT